MPIAAGVLEWIRYRGSVTLGVGNTYGIYGALLPSSSDRLPRIFSLAASSARHTAVLTRSAVEPIYIWTRKGGS